MKRVLIVLLFIIPGLTFSVRATEEPSVSAVAHLLIGFPDDDAPSPGTLVVPGIVLPVDGLETSWSPTHADLRSSAITSLADNLRSSLRLGSVEVNYGILRVFEVGKPQELPGPVPGSPISLRATLLGSSDELASFRVEFQQGPVTLGDTKVAIPRGTRVVFGGLDGEQAPYIFLVLEPQKKDVADAIHLGEDFTPPRARVKIPPKYTEEARKERLEGIVIVQAIIETDGSIGDIRVLKGLSMGLEEAAVQAIRQWSFDPALDPDGNPVRVFYNLTINFRLEKKPPTEEPEG